MGRFSSPAKQARSIINALRKEKIIPSIRSGQNYQERLTVIGKKCEQWGLPRLRDMSSEDCIKYLERRGEEVSQATLNTERLALQYTLELMETLDRTKNERLPTVKSQKATIKKPKIYTSQQIQMIRTCMSEPYKFTLDLILSCGLSAVEAYTLRPVSEQPATYHQPTVDKFVGLKGVRYTVKGNYGITREVLIPAEIAERLEKLRLENPVVMVDRGVPYQKYYDVRAGRLLSSVFSQASKRALGWSHGVNTLRKAYETERLKTLTKHGIEYSRARKAIRLEMGYVAPRINR